MCVSPTRLWESIISRTCVLFALWLPELSTQQTFTNMFLMNAHPASYSLYVVYCLAVKTSLQIEVTIPIIQKKTLSSKILTNEEIQCTHQVNGKSTVLTLASKFTHCPTYFKNKLLWSTQSLQLSLMPIRTLPTQTTGIMRSWEHEKKIRPNTDLAWPGSLLSFLPHLWQALWINHSTMDRVSEPLNTVLLADSTNLLKYHYRQNISATPGSETYIVLAVGVSVFQPNLLFANSKTREK